MKKYIINTTTDKNYVHFAAALIRSLDCHCSTDIDREYIYNVYCFDRHSFEKVGLERETERKINLLQVRMVDEFNKDGDYKMLQKKPPSYEALNVGKQKEIDPKYMDLLWNVASFSTHHIMKTQNPSGGVIYIDADCYFLNNWTKIMPILEEKSIGLVRNNAKDDNNGEYNVSFIFFKNDLVGNRALFAWRNWLLNPENEYAKEYGVCADQKYLDLFPKLFGKENICVLDDEGIVQTAPWSQHDALKSDLFYHFSDFRPDYEKGVYKPAPRHRGPDAELKGFTKNLYDEYYELTRYYYRIFGKFNK